jgi:hypothetical protein
MFSMRLKRGLLSIVFFSFVAIAYSQTSPAAYARKWAAIDSLLEKKGLSQSALEQVNGIYTVAQKEKNEPQLIKALVYRLRLERTKSEDGIKQSIGELGQQIEKTMQPAKSILQNLLAGVYLDYWQANSWKIYRRTNTLGEAGADISTWTAEDLNKKISNLFLASLQNEALLAGTDLGGYEPIIIRGNMRWLHPTLFDLLARNALEYFKANDAYVGKYSVTLKFEDTAIYADAGDFASHRFKTADSLHPQFQTLLLFQRMIRRHLHDADANTLADLDVSRIISLDDSYSEQDKPVLYQHALHRLTRQYPEAPATDRAWFVLAEQYINEASTGEDSLGRVSAREICANVVAKQDSSEGWINCRDMLNSLDREGLSLSMERINIPNRPMRVLVQWSNFTRLYFRVLRVRDAVRSPSLDVNDSAGLARLLSEPAIRTGYQQLPYIRDYFQHSVEIALGSLPPGDYVLAATNDSSWSGRKGVISAGPFTVSILSYISQGNDFFVLNRETGRPIAGSVVQFWSQASGGLPLSHLAKAESYTTDEEGHFRLSWKKNNFYGARIPEFTIPGDHLFTRQGGFSSYYPGKTGTPDKDKITYEQEQLQTILFTDRAIYRPGQTVYFKGLLVTRDFETHRAKLLSGDSCRLFLLDAHDEDIDSMDAVTSDFGSFHGSFRIPEGGLNGNFQIESRPGNGTIDFSVEEYKRPKFYVTFEKQKGSYKIGDTIHVAGDAQAYAGSAIGGGKVRWSVNRRIEYPQYEQWRSPWSQSQTIEHGEAVTDAQGKFSIVFHALPDQGTKRDWNPEYVYSIDAGVTDIDGETREGWARLIAGYSAIKLTVGAGGRNLPSDSLRMITVRASNLSGAPVSANVDVAIYPLKAPQRLVKNRLWTSPDRYVLSENEFLDSFPHDEYRNELEVSNWEKGKPSWEGSVQIPGEGSGAGKVELAVPAGSMTPGTWLIEAHSTDSFGHLVKDLHYVTLYDGKTGNPGMPEYNWTVKDPGATEPGSSAITESGSSADVYVIQTVQQRGASDTNQFSHYSMNGQRKQSGWKITEADRGGFGVLDAWVIDNRIYSNYSKVEVPWTNKQLNICYSTYRNKMEPGSAEKWTMTVSGRKGEKVFAEILTSMYDASLDQLEKRDWLLPNFYPPKPYGGNWITWGNFESAESRDNLLYPLPGSIDARTYDRLIDVRGGYAQPRSEEMAPKHMKLAKSMSDDMNANFMAPVAPQAAAEGVAPANAMLNLSASGMGGKAPGAPAPIIQPRRDFRETAFFLPDLHTDSAGNVSFSFTMPEAVTSWKWMTLAHTRDLAFGYGEKTVITQKKLMVQPNAPRFLREGDRMELPVKVVNLTDSELTGQMSLELTDPTTGQTADGWFTNRQANQFFTVGARQSTVVSFPLDVPYQYNRPLTYKVVAQSGAYSDGEEATLPVVSNRLLVTESLPLNMPGDGTRHFTFDKLLKSAGSETLNHHALTVEFTANPAWYAVQSLPYLMEYPHECSEQVFERVYANALATHVATASPRLQQVFERWRSVDTAQLLSNLQKNQELKNVLLEETPWVMEGKSEAQQKKNLALLFDMHRMSTELGAAVDRLTQMQAEDGAFPWWSGGPDNRYITQYILTGIGHLQHLKAMPPGLAGRLDTIVATALPYLDAQMKKDYDRERAAEARAAKTPAGHAHTEAHLIGPMQVHYLYIRSFFANRGLPGTAFAAVNYFRKKAQHDWVRCSPYLQGMIALALYRTGDVATAKDIIASLKQNAIRDEERGMYWKGMDGGYYWWQAPVETQSLLIEAFHEVNGDAAIDRDLKTWLLRQKQTHNWPTTTATADACYALLTGGDNWLNAERSVNVHLGDKTIDWPAGSGDAGIGYNKKVFDGAFVNTSMGNITVTMETKGGSDRAPGNAGSASDLAAGNGGGSPAWGAVYWQYFEMLDRITPPGGSKPALSVTKKIFIRRDTDHGPLLEPLADNGELKPGDRVVARIELRADRDMEYVHMKDMRAACLEPVNVLSAYKWQDGLGYYESTKDASTDFFFDIVPRGTYVFEYDMLAGQAGNFSNGITTIECLYAPEFTWHTEGIRVNVEGGN